MSTQIDQDAILEAQIQQAQKHLVASANDPQALRAARDCLYSLIKQRSPEQVARMEREKGLV
jgi:hypothetical protein